MTAHLIVCTTRRSGVHHQTITSGTADDHVWYSRRSRLPASADVVLPDDHVWYSRRSRLHHQTITSARYTFSSAHPDVLVCSVHRLVGSPRRARLLGTPSRRLTQACSSARYTLSSARYTLSSARYTLSSARYTCSSARYTLSSARPDVLVCSVHALVGSPRRARLLGTRSRRVGQACSSGPGDDEGGSGRRACAEHCVVACSCEPSLQLPGDARGAAHSARTTTIGLVTPSIPS
jgi:hypothetical protein